jgi:tRNA threonylcarbamoyladenosine biosynthesis protein TsaE
MDWPAHHVVTRSEVETANVGRGLAARLQAGDVVLLRGDLGSGKTAFVRGLAEGLGIDPAEVSSPTFTIIQEYRGGRVLLLHVDLYRLEPKEVADLGLDELGEQAVVAIEWAERLPSRPAEAISVEITHEPGDSREVNVFRVGGTETGDRPRPEE